MQTFKKKKKRQTDRQTMKRRKTAAAAGKRMSCKQQSSSKLPTQRQAQGQLGNLNRFQQNVGFTRHSGHRLQLQNHGLRCKVALSNRATQAPILNRITFLGWQMESSMERERVFLRSTWEEGAEAGLHLFESLGRTG